MKTSYQILEKFCKVRNTDSKNPITNRVKFINNYLEINKIKYINRIVSSSTFKECSLFDNDSKFCNVEISFNQYIGLKKSSKPRLILIAHHDVANINSDNMNDNTASCSQLLCLANWAKTKDYPITIILNDIEERGMYGSAFLAKQIKNDVYGKDPMVLNLELCGFGNEIHIENIEDSNLHTKLVSFNNRIVSWDVPTNDSYRLRDYGVDYICIGILPTDEIEHRNKTGAAKCWVRMHRDTDSFSFANDLDMKNLNLFLRKFIKNEFAK